MEEDSHHDASELDHTQHAIYLELSSIEKHEKILDVILQDEVE